MRKILCRMGKLKPECIDHYRELYAAVPPEVTAAIARCSLRDYSVFLADDLVVCYCEYVGTDFAADQAAMAAEPAVVRWREQTRHCFVRDSGERESYYQEMEHPFYCPGA